MSDKPPDQVIEPPLFANKNIFYPPSVAAGGTGGADTANTSTASAGTGGEGAAKALPNRRKPRGNDYKIIPGSRSVKSYPVTRDELLGLGAVSAVATLSFSVGGTLVGRAVDLRSNIELSGVSDVVKAKFETKAEDYMLFGIILLVFGALTTIFGGLKCISIWWSTQHAQ